MQQKPDLLSPGEVVYRGMQQVSDAGAGKGADDRGRGAAGGRNHLEHRGLREEELADRGELLGGPSSALGDQGAVDFAFGVDANALVLDANR